MRRGSLGHSFRRRPTPAEHLVFPFFGEIVLLFSRPLPKAGQCSRGSRRPQGPQQPPEGPSPPGNSVLVGSSSSSQRTTDLLTTKNLHANRLASAVGQSRHLPPPSCVSTLQPLRARATLQIIPVLLCAPSRERLSAMINPRMFVAPAAAFTMACLLLAYTRSSIRVAREQSRIRTSSSGDSSPKKTPES